MALTSTEEALVRQLLDQQAAILSLAENEATISSKLGATKVTLSDLVAASGVTQNDLLLVRQGTTDKSARAELLKNYVGEFDQIGDNSVPRSFQDKLLEFVSVFDFMSEAQKADVRANTALIDVTAAINTAIQTAKTLKIKGVFFPRGTYRTSSSINIKGNFDNGIVLKGDKAKINCTANTEVMYVDAKVPEAAPEYRIQVIIEGFVISGTGKANLASVALYLHDCANVSVRDCTLRNAYRALAGFGCLISDFRDLIIRESYHGIQFENTVNFAPNDIHFTNCQVIDNVQAIRAVNFDYGAWTFTNCEIEGNNLLGNAADTIRVCEFFSAGEVNFIGCHFEMNYGTYNIFYSGNRHLNILGCKIIPGDLTGNVIYMDNGELFMAGTHCTTNVGNNVYLTATCDSATIIGDMSAGVQGDLSKLVRINRGVIEVQGAASGVAGITAKSAYGIGLDTIGVNRFVDASYNRLGYQGATGVMLDAAAQYSVSSGNGQILFFRTGKVVEPASDNQYNLGSAPLRWGTVYAATGTINTSDERAKQQVEAIPQEWLDAWADVEYTRFKFNDAVKEKGDKARWHVGFIAQRVKEAFEARGLNPFAIGILCYDEWEDITMERDVLGEDGLPVIGEDGQTQKETYIAKVQGDQYGIRYEEALALECAYLRSLVRK